MQEAGGGVGVEDVSAVHPRVKDKAKGKAQSAKAGGAATRGRSSKADDTDIIDVDALDRFRVFREEKFIYAEDLVEAFSTRRQPYSIKRARRLVMKSRGFQECDRGRWMCLRTHFAEAYPELYVALVEHEVDQI
jgi:hypothetical protein